MVVASDEWWRGDRPMRWNDNLDAGEVNGEVTSDKYKRDKRDKGDDCALADVLDQLAWLNAKLDLLLTLTLSRRDTTRQRRAAWDRAV